MSTIKIQIANFYQASIRSNFISPSVGFRCKKNGPALLNSLNEHLVYIQAGGAYNFSYDGKPVNPNIIHFLSTSGFRALCIK